LDTEWLLSTLFDASLLSTSKAAGNGGSFFWAYSSPRFPVSSFRGARLRANPETSIAHRLWIPGLGASARIPE
jgi:hypothetical protein